MIGYLDTPSGISGDMFLGCLVDAGWPLAELESVVARLGLPPGACTLAQEQVMRGPLAATLVKVDAPETHVHRHLGDIERIIREADLPAPVQERAVAVFRRLAHAEAAVHGSTVEEVHFHEVGAIDAIVDIVGACAGLHALGVEKLYASALPLGEGWTNSAHGRIPLPAPATLALLAEAGAPTRPAPGPGELVTPTGAALLAELAEFRQPRLRVQRIGLGAGSKEFDWPNVARLWLGEPEIDTQPNGGKAQTSYVVIEANIDDMNPELYEPIGRRLFDRGAADVWVTPIQMKKGRPGVTLSVLAPAALEAKLAEAVLHETTTLGVRVRPVQRYEADRSVETVKTEFGPVRVKLKRVGGALLGVKPEFEDCARLAQEWNVPVRLVNEGAQAAAYRLYGRPDD
jgi:uncharacterized protein (TIGR00299 family) protein